jgi:hypothetical protein
MSIAALQLVENYCMVFGLPKEEEGRFETVV